ncbi:MAG: hypothetical protein NW203_11125 [Hyphomonadaceae bacterium]|nr:hypothetical protein [Hyphomonadaceae bacterium]
MRIAAALAAWIMTAVAAQAQTPAPEQPAALDAVYACAAETDDARRLACYDQAVGRLRVAQQEGDFAAISPEQVRRLERESFGFSLPSLPRLVMPRFGGGEGEAAEALEALQMEIARIEPRGPRVAFRMTNDQVWVQTESRRVAGIRTGDAVTIRRAAMGGYMLVPEHGAPHRVRREE